MIIKIPLTRGLFALIDDADFEFVTAHKWWAIKTYNRYYAQAAICHGGNAKTGILMHRLIMTAPKGIEIDHRDGNGLNNTRSNLRLATRSQNARNQKKHWNSSSGYKGVSFSKANGKFRAMIKADGRHHHLGYFSTAKDAHAAYCIAAIKLHGEFANFGGSNGS